MDVERSSRFVLNNFECKRRKSIEKEKKNKWKRILCILVKVNNMKN